jgi:ferric-dicitrate binding protein FerR (iron transport regulator)
MNKSTNKFEISEIIVKYYLGICSVSEKENFSKWLQEKPENQKLYNQIINQKDISKKINEYQLCDTKNKYNNIKPQLTTIKKVKLHQRLLRYAAIFILPILTGGLLFWYMNYKSTETTAISISPGYSKAILKTADGAVIVLEDKKFKNIKEKDGTLIHNDTKTISFHSVSNNDIKITPPVIEEINIPRGGEFHVILPDGTKVWLNSETVFEFPSRFTGKERKVRLKSGEAYFEVIENKQMPFIVEVNEMKIKVLGTSFNVSAYKDESHIKTTLVKGKVQLISKVSDYKTEKLILSPGEQGSLSYKNKFLMKKEVDTRLYTSWTKGEFVFKNDNIEDVLKKLARWYNVDIVFENQDSKTYHFTGTLKKHENISVLIDLIHYTSKLKFNLKDNTIYVKGVSIN